MRNSEHAHRGQPLSRAQFLIFAIVSFGAPLVFSSCNTLKQGEPLTPENPAAEPVARGNDSAFNYCPLEAVRQPSSKANGLAALAAVMIYWEHEVDLSALEANYPAKSDEGYPLLQLRRIATREGLIAFALTMKDRPLEQVSEQLENGRPVIVPIAPTADQPAASEPETPLQNGTTKHQYVVIFGQSSDQFLLMDPADGIVKVRKNEFLESWSKEKFAALLCSSF